MSLTADLDRARVSVLLDVRHPLAYLALHPAIALGRTHRIAINWLPLAVPTLRPPSPEAVDDDRGTRHRRHRAQALAREIETYAAAQGLVLREYYRSESADAAHLGWLWVRDRHPALLEAYLVALFRAYWSSELDASRVSAVAGIVGALDADVSSFLAWAPDEGVAAAAALTAELRDRGLFQVPGYVVGDEVFYGRQHLPMIAWLLGGRAGPGPI